MTTEAKFFTGWVFFCLMFVGCKNNSIELQDNVTVPKWKVVTQHFANTVYQVKIDGIDYLIAQRPEAICIIPKVVSKPEKEQP